MGCFQSKFAKEDEHPRVRRAPVNTFNQQQVPPITITKAHSVVSIDSAINQTTSDTPVVVNEKPPVVIEEGAYEYQYESAAPCGATQLKRHSTIIRHSKHIVVDEPQAMDDDEPTSPITATEVSETINPPQASHEPTTTTEIPEATTATEEAGILPTTAPTHASSDVTIIVRLSSGKDITVPIPTTAPFMTIAQLKLVIAQNHVRFIHLGRLLPEEYMLIPAKSPVKCPNAIYIANHGVIQAMIYQPA